jgi:hypothetical protein
MYAWLELIQVVSYANFRFKDLRVGIQALELLNNLGK